MDRAGWLRILEDDDLWNATIESARDPAFEATRGRPDQSGDLAWFKRAVADAFVVFEDRARGKLRGLPDDEPTEILDHFIEDMIRANFSQRLEPDLAERFMLKLAEKRRKLFGPSRSTH